MSKVLMIMGTMSSAGKSLITTGLCRYYARQGLRILPFKAQNMSNNAAVCPSGGEIGRAQAAQAMAAGVEPTTDMNPILLKPEADLRSQLIIHGKSCGSFSAQNYYAQYELLWKTVTESLERLRTNADLIIIEGAGSISELNLTKTDIVNMAVARHASAPCLLVGDINRGGIFAQLLGSWWLLEETDRRYLKGFIVNQFRGDSSLFENGRSILEQRSQGIPVLGVLPWLEKLSLPDEDAASFSSDTICNSDAKPVYVIRFPHISNFDDFDPLRFETGISLRYITHPGELINAAAILLPGTKNTLEDLCWLNETGLDNAICKHANSGCSVVGICGGYQMLGNQICNPQHIECSQESVAGLELLPVHTILNSQKHTQLSEMRVISKIGFWHEMFGKTLTGYEIHNGQTRTDAPLFITENNGFDGCAANGGRIFGTYLHGLFGNNAFRQSWLRSLDIQPVEKNWQEHQSAQLDRLANHLEAHLDMERITQIIEDGVQ